ncbi:MAG: hypothetical protein ACK58L_04115 [Planctomycetota bacterium]
MMFCFSLLMNRCFVLVMVAGASTPHTSIRVMTKHESDRVEVRSAESAATISIRSPAGISHAVIERGHERWPDSMLVRLHLKGLESFRVASDQVTLHASVSSQDGKVRVWKGNDEERLLDEQSPYWIDVSPIGCDGRPTKVIPITDGYVEIRLPRLLFEHNPKSITLNWIDFYRN